MDSNIIILMSLLCIPIVLVAIIGLNIVCVKGILELLNLLQKWQNDYIQKKIDEAIKKRRLRQTEKEGNKKDQNSKKKQKHKWVKRLFLWSERHYILASFIASIFAACLFVAILIIYHSLSLDCCCKSGGFITDKERVVLAFVGILATFIVVTNHAQTAEISRKLEKQLDKNKQEMDALRSHSMKIQQSLSDNTGRLVQKAFTQNLEFIDACQEKDTIPCARRIAVAFTNNNLSTFLIRYVGAENREESMTLVRREERLYFRNYDESKILSIASAEIKSVDFMEYNHEYIEPLVFNLILINEQKQKE